MGECGQKEVIWQKLQIVFIYNNSKCMNRLKVTGTGLLYNNNNNNK